MPIHDPDDPCCEGIRRIAFFLGDAETQGRIDRKKLSMDTWFTKEERILGYRVNLKIDGESKSVRFEQRELVKAEDENYFLKEVAPRLEDLLSS